MLKILILDFSLPRHLHETKPLCLGSKFS